MDNQTTTTTDDDVQEQQECSLGNIDFSNVFMDPILLFLGIAIALILTAPALSVFCRKTNEQPLPTYKYSCLVKFIAGFLGTSFLVGDLYTLSRKDCENYLFVKGWVPVYAAMATELVEFMFDFGRLVVFWTDSGKIDFYQNVRWNTLNERNFNASISALPVAISVLGMWIFVSAANYTMIFNDWFLDTNVEMCEPDYNYNGTAGLENGEYSAGSMENCKSEAARRMFLAGSALFAGIASSGLGAYYLCRMMCHCSANDGENRGIGFFWRRWKLTAVDLPSITFALYRPLSNLSVFWTMETFNDLFPLVLGSLIDYWLNRDLKEVNVRDKYASNVGISKEPMLTALMRVRKRKGSFYIDRRAPEIIKAEMSDSEWIVFCEKIDFALQPFGVVASSYFKSTIKTGLILCAMVLSVVYWVIFYFITNNIWGMNFVSTGSIVLLTFFFILGLVICCKACHSRDFEEEDDAFEDLTAVCDAESDLHPNVKFVVHIRNEIPLIKSLKWIFWKGFSCNPPLTSIRHIECRIKESQDEVFYP